MPSQPSQIESKRREGSPNPASETDYRFRRRLALCLDGTWNERDSGTNVYHLSNLILEGKIEPDSSTKVESTAQERADATWVQMVYYDEGVGTGLLDNVTGGAFGIGLSENVREAYDWLVERYRDGDEVYVFGFSRGAYTARSLVGLIANCGLLYRGAPLPPEELWNGYQQMAPYPPPLYPDGTRVPVRTRWRPSGTQKPGPFRPLNHLKPDSFPGAGFYQFFTPWNKMNETERLLYQWSRRIPIHCLGIFDTVRTLGIEALAIPWLRDRKTQFHRTQLTWLIQNGFHALAIDEHRANFSHVPWHRKTRGAKATEEQAEKSGKIRQRWFIGAHSNVGGSYDDGTLAQLPLAWLVQECSRLGLVFKALARDEPDVRRKTELKDCIPLWSARDESSGNLEPGHVRDSYTELGGGIWRHLIRAKRHYRRIGPPAEFQDGEEVKSLNEALDDSVLKLMTLDIAQVGSQTYNPPNLYEYRQRKQSQSPEPANELGPALIEPPHIYCETAASKRWLAVWLFGIALSGELISQLALRWKPHWLHVIIPVFFVAVGAWVDRRESLLTHQRAVRPLTAATETLNGWLDLLMNLRMIAVGLFVVGVGFAIWLAVRFTFYPVPLVEAVWLVAFCAMLMHFNASKIWAAAPMKEAGFGSIVELQMAKTPAEVVALRDAWQSLCLRPSDEAKMSEPLHNPDSHRLLPVHRTIWRDRIGFIPAYTLAFCAGLWVTLSLVHCWPFLRCPDKPILHVVTLHWWGWVPAILILIGVVADYIEDSIHIGYLERPAELPPPGRVRTGWALSWVKLGGCILGMTGLVAAILLLASLQVRHAVGYFRAPDADRYWTEHIPAASFTIPALASFFLALLAIYLAASTIIAFGPREPKIRCR